ncbi:MAG: YkgJ family cysteine cluster protein [Bacillota bacterium]|nr:YkgJ family cysteine cluster protein [Thermoanaerobacteraceae bacterium]
MSFTGDTPDEKLFKEIQPDECFNFECSGRCMGKCCRFITILLDPWDVEVIARHLNLPGPEFLELFCTYDFGSSSSWPFVQLKHAEKGPCAFLLKDGRCSIYPVRPRNCRTYPIGRAVQVEYAGDIPLIRERLFMVERMEFCLGHEGSRTWTVKEWLEDSEAYKYYELSDLYLCLVQYATDVLHSRAWLSPKTARLLMPLLYFPDILRAKLGISEAELDHELFYRRRLKAARTLLTEMAASFGYGPLAGGIVADQNTPLAEHIRQVIIGEH